MSCSSDTTSAIKSIGERRSNQSDGLRPETTFDEEQIQAIISFTSRLRNRVSGVRIPFHESGFVARIRSLMHDACSNLKMASRESPRPAAVLGAAWTAPGSRTRIPFQGSCPNTDVAGLCALPKTGPHCLTHQFLIGASWPGGPPMKSEFHTNSS